MPNDLPSCHMMQRAPVYIGRGPADALAFALAFACTPVALLCFPTLLLLKRQTI